MLCSEVLEHIDDWQAALENLALMSRRYLLITVPSGKLHKIDQHIGHSRHFGHAELVAAVQRFGLSATRIRYWGFPFHSLYKYAINVIAPDKVYASFGEQSYGFSKRLISVVLYWLFFPNDLFYAGAQLLILAERKEPNSNNMTFGRGVDL